MMKRIMACLLAAVCLLTSFAFAEGLYMKVVNTYPIEEQEPQPSEPAQMDVQVPVMPVRESTPVGAVYVDYTNGHHEEWPADGTQLGILTYTGGTTVTFLSNIGYFPAGDGWYPNHVLMLDMGGNAVYEVLGGGDVILGAELDEANLCRIHLPADTLTAAAPAGITIVSGDYTAYDAIPAQGVTVTSMNVTYGDEANGDIGSEGVSSPDLIGTLFHDYGGNVEFHSSEPMTMDVPSDTHITHISFMDARGNLIFEARCPGGVGDMTYDENGYLIFRAAVPGSEVPQTVPQETIPEETEVEATEAPEEPEAQTGFARERLSIHKAPSTEAEVVGTVDVWEEIRIITRKTYDGTQWGLIPGGWVLMDKVLTEEAAAPVEADAEHTEATTGERTVYAEPNTDSKVLGTLAAGEEPELLDQDTVNGMVWGLTPEGWILLEQTEAEEAVPAPAAETLPQETVFPEETEAAPEPMEKTSPARSVTEPEAVMETTPAETVPTEPATLPESDVETGLYYDSGARQDMIAEYVWEPIPEGCTMTIRLAPGALRAELGWTLLRRAEAFRSILLEVLGICIAVFALCVVHLCCSAGRTRRNNEVRAGGLNRIPLDLYLVGAGMACMGLTAGAVYGGEYLVRGDEELAIVFCGASAYLVCLLIVGAFFAVVAQFKTPGGFWWRHSLCGWSVRTLFRGGRLLTAACETGWRRGKPMGLRFFRWTGRTCVKLWKLVKKTVLWIWDTTLRLARWALQTVRRWLGRVFCQIGKIFRLLPVTWQFLVTGFMLVLMLYVMMRTYKVGYILLGFGIFFGVLLYAASAFGILLENARRMSRGDLDTKVDDRVLIGAFKDFAGELNDLADVAVVAAQKQLKSERMKTELITNVSHDIKTPLTSIINYVDLLQKPHSEQQQEQYLEVLERQSQRLKKLIDDLMEMSKASTGNMAVEIVRMDAGEAVNQALGEFADKLDRAQLIPVFRQPDEPVEMLADGRLVWRVMSNLLGNAVKYALPGTRIYLDLMTLDGKVVISMKNISREELNVHADELMERFVRGDASRNTEGSGLGLNIAQSLMELQKGQLQILVDGDLFKVTMIFPSAEK